MEPCDSDDGGASVPEGRKGKRCCGVLLGHTADVSHIKWNAVHSRWVTGSEDYTVRLWTGDGVEESKWLPGDAVSALAIDQTAGFVIAASMDLIVRVYDPVSQEVVQQHAGHSDAVRRAMLYDTPESPHRCSACDCTSSTMRCSPLSLVSGSLHHAHS